MSDGRPSIPVSTHFTREHYLYAFAGQGELANQIRTQAIPEERERLSEIVAAWHAAQERVRAKLEDEVGPAETASVESLSDADYPELAAYRADPLFQRTFSHSPHEFALFEVYKLVAAQRRVSLDHVEQLTDSLPGSPAMPDLVSLCLSPQRDLAAIQHLEISPNTHVFRSPNADMRFLGSYIKEDLSPGDLALAEFGGIPAAAVIAFVGFGGAPVNAYRVRKRLVLNNGFHRVYALRRLGVTKVPAVVQDVTHPQFQFPATISDLPRNYLLGAGRPVLMQDFFEPNFSITLKVRERNKVVILGMNLGQHDVPT